MEAERARATKQKLAGKRIEGTTRETLVKQRAQETFKRQREVAKPTPTTPTLTTEQAARIKAGTLKATKETTAAVKAGTAIIQDPTPGEKLKDVGGAVLGAIAITPIGRGGTTITSLFGKQSKKTITSLLGNGIGKGAEPGLGVATNTATKKLIDSAADKVVSKTVISKGWKIAASAAAALIIVKEILTLTLGGKVFGQFIGMEEASQTLGFAASQALRAGDLESYDELATVRDDILKEPTFWDNIKALIPFKNVGDQLEKYRIAAVASGKVFDKLAEDRRIQIETGETDDERWKRVKQEEDEMRREYKTWSIEQDKIRNDNEREARAAVRKATNAAERKARNEDAEFWANEKAKEREREAADRKAIADFWAAYKKIQQKIQQDNRPSNLNFGLL